MAHADNTEITTAPLRRVRFGAALFAGVLLVAACESGGVASSTTTRPPETETTDDTSLSENEPARIVSLFVNGADVGLEDGVFMLPGPVNPGEVLQFEAVIADDEDGVLTILDSEAAYQPTADNSSVSLDVTVPPDLRSTEIPVLLNGAEMALVGFQPGEQWAPITTVANPTGLTGEATIEVEVFDLNGPDSVETLTVIQEFNFQHPDHANLMADQHGLTPLNTEPLEDGLTYVGFEDPRYDFIYTADKTIDEYVSTESLAPIEIETTTPGQYQIHLNSQWPGRFPLHLTATDTTGNRTETRVPIEIYWDEQPWEMRGIAVELQYLRAGASVDMAGQLVDLASGRNMNYVQITDTAVMSEIDGTNVFSCDEVPSAQDRCITLTEQQLIDLVDHAHDLGLGVMLKPHVWASDFNGFDISPASWGEWFASYTEFVVEKAKIAEATGIEILSIGNELTSSHYQPSSWRTLVGKVREVYSGLLTYSDFTYWTGDDEGWFPLEDELDILGVPFYYPGIGTNQQLYHETVEVHDDPTMLAMTENIADNISLYLTPRMEATGRPAIATELGRFNHDGTSWNPWEGERIDTQEQIDWFEATLRNASAHTEGVFFWAYKAHPESSLGQIDIDLRATAVHELARIWSRGG